MDYSKAINSVADTISKASKPLSEAQKMLMAGAMAVWLEKAATDEREAVMSAILDECPSDGSDAEIILRRAWERVRVMRSNIV